jgi:oligoribonuclease
MAQDANALIWIDLEMSGLSPERDRILELAVVVTDARLDTVVEGPVIAVHQDDATLDGMDAWNKSTHARTGLVERVRSSAIGEADAEAQVIAFLLKHVPKGASPMCGNSVCQDRRFLARYMPELETYFHYRNLDVSTLKELARRWKPSIVGGFAKQGKHEALADIQESIAELRYYREHLLQL